MLGIRMFRLSEPYEMHFDEVYHARTATEFLQDWRYGMPHDIYEYTHPHLAKYAMAGGLVAWGDDRVTATSGLGVPVLDAAIEPRNDDPAFAGDRAGDRVDVVTGSELRSYDLDDPRARRDDPDPGRRARWRSTRPASGCSSAADDGVDLDRSTSTALDTVRNRAPAASRRSPSRSARSTARSAGCSSRRTAARPRGRDLATTGSSRSTAVGRGPRHGPAPAAPSDIAPGGHRAGPVTRRPTRSPTRRPLLERSPAIFGGDAATYEGRLRATADRPVIAPIANADQRTKVQKAIDDGTLAG